MYIQDEDLHRADILRRLCAELETGTAALQGFDISMSGDVIQMVVNIEPRQKIHTAVPVLDLMRRMLGGE